MAARENQGYLIAVIILVLLSLVLALVAFLGWSKATENADLREAAEQKEVFLTALQEANETRGEILKAMIGNFGPTMNEYDVMLNQIEQKASNRELDSAQQEQIRQIAQDVKNIKTEFDNDTQGTGVVADGEVAKQTTYREFLTNLINLTSRKVKQVNIQARQTDLKEQEAQRRIDQMQSTVQTTQEEMENLRTTLEKEKQLARENEEKFKNQLADAATTLQKANEAFDSYREQAEERLSGLQNSVNSLTEENQIVKAKLNSYERESFVNADGQIVNVAAPLKSVFIDLGADDGLINNMTFSVYDQGTRNFNSENMKAAIEVIRVNQNGAEAKITQMDPSNPILPGDLILTPTWDPGYPTKIALVGRFDLDGDDVDDTEKLAREIERNGGIVIAKIGPDDKIQGEIDPTTRYLVKGNAPIIEGSAELSNSIKMLTQQAERNTVEVIDLQKLQARMGVRSRKTKSLKQLGMGPGGLPNRPAPGDAENGDQ